MCEKFSMAKRFVGIEIILGLVNQLGHMLPDLAGLTVLRQLLHKYVAFLWTDEINAEFEKYKSTLCGPLVFPFDPALKAELLTAASKLYGLSWALMQCLCVYPYVSLHQRGNAQ